MLCRTFEIHEFRGVSFYIWQNIPYNGFLDASAQLPEQLVRHVRAVLITTTDSRIRLGTYFGDILSNGYFPYVFSAAESLCLEIDKDCVYEDAYDSDDSSTDIGDDAEEERVVKAMGAQQVQSNVVGFIDFCKQRLPKMQEVRASMGKRNGYWHRDLHVLTQELQRLCEQARRSSLSLFFWDYPECLLHPGSNGLTNLEIAWHSHGGAAQVVVHNALSLQSLRLDIGAFVQNNVCELFGPCADVVYPQLTKLHIDGAQGQASTECLEIANPDYVPFPKLRYLHIGTHYPVASNVLLRGNAHLLDYLYVVIDFMSLGILANVFSNVKLSSLRHAEFPLHGRYSHSTFQSGPDIPQMKQLIAVLPRSLHTLRLSSNVHTTQSLISGLHQQYFCDLQVLQLNSMTIGLQSLCSILTRLPSLCNLGIALIELDNTYKENGIEHNARRLSKQFGPLGKRLVKVSAHGLLDAQRNPNREIAQLAHCCLVLSRICERRLIVQVDPEIQALFCLHYDQCAWNQGDVTRIEQPSVEAGSSVIFLMQSLMLLN